MFPSWYKTNEYITACAFSYCSYLNTVPAAFISQMCSFDQKASYVLAFQTYNMAYTAVQNISFMSSA